jgi:hypothetical protein
MAGEVKDAVSKNNFLYSVTFLQYTRSDMKMMFWLMTENDCLKLKKPDTVKSAGFIFLIKEKSPFLYT